MVDAYNRVALYVTVCPYWAVRASSNLASITNTRVCVKIIVRLSVRPFMDMYGLTTYTVILNY